MFHRVSGAARRLAARLRAHLEGRAQAEDGAVSIDWVVLSAAMVSLAVAAADQISGAVLSLGAKITQELDETDPD